MHAPRPPAPSTVLAAGGEAAYRRDAVKERKYPCATCGKRFTRPSSLACHRRIHTGEKPHMCRFPGCERRFSVQSNLRRHTRIHEKTLPSPTPTTATGGSPVLERGAGAARRRSAATPAMAVPAPLPVWSGDEAALRPMSTLSTMSAMPLRLAPDTALWPHPQPLALAGLDMAALCAPGLEFPLSAPALAPGAAPPFFALPPAPRAVVTPPPPPLPSLLQRAHTDKHAAPAGATPGALPHLLLAPCSPVSLAPCQPMSLTTPCQPVPLAPCQPQLVQPQYAPHSATWQFLANSTQ